MILARSYRAASVASAASLLLCTAAACSSDSHVATGVGGAADSTDTPSAGIGASGGSLSASGSTSGGDTAGVGATLGGAVPTSNGDGGDGTNTAAGAGGAATGDAGMNGSGAATGGGSAGDSSVAGNSGGGRANTGLASCGGAKMGILQTKSATRWASDFRSGTLDPFTVCTTQQPNYGKAVTVKGVPSAQFYWSQAAYNGTRMLRGAEACSGLEFYKEGWYGFQFYLPSPGFPLDKTEGIAQIFNNGGCSSWAAMLQVHGKELWIEHRANCASPAEYQVRLATDIPRNTWVPVVMHFVASSQNAGGIEIWVGNAVCTPQAPTYRKMGINFGFGAWTGDSLTAMTGNHIGLKFGMYNFDEANFTIGETRTLYYTNLSQLTGSASNGFSTVNPAP